MIYFSRSTSKFYDIEAITDIHPADLVHISQERYQEIQEGISVGMTLSNDSMGFPILIERQAQDVSPRDLAKEARNKAVSEIVVTTSSGKQFDGDEESQNRMARAIVAIQHTGAFINWTLADNTIVTVNADELREALILAGSKQTELWSI